MTMQDYGSPGDIFAIAAYAEALGRMARETKSEQAPIETEPVDSSASPESLIPSALEYDQDLAKSLVSDIAQELNELRENLKKTAKTKFVEGTKALFTMFPTLTSFGWDQYTPYFNDGDECVFRVNTDVDFIVINDVEYEETYDVSYDESAADYHERWKTRKETILRPDIRPFFGLISDFLEAVGGDTLKDIFGDHVSIRVTSTGYEVEEKSHD